MVDSWEARREQREKMQDAYAIQVEGYLTITFKNAMLTNDVNLMMKMNPYCRLAYKGSVWQTRVHQKGGKYPVWNETFRIPVHRLTDILKVIVYGQDMSISACTIPSLQFCDILLGTVPGEVSARGLELRNGSEEAGNLNIEYKWEPFVAQPGQ